MAKRKRKLHREFPFLLSCFGRAYDRPCRCPDTLESLCQSVHLTQLRSPIPLRPGRGERRFGYTAIDNRIFRQWCIAEHEPCDSVKMTYAFLVSKADVHTRWVYAKPRKRAEERGIPERTLVEHEKALERMELVLRVPYNKINTKSVRRFRTIILLDLPRGFAVTLDAEEQAADEAFAANETERSGKHSVPREIIDGQIDDEISGETDDDEWGPRRPR